MTDRVKQLTKFVGAVVVSLLLAGLGAYILRSFRTSAGLGAGLLCELLALAVAFPTQFHDGTLALKENLVLIVPVIVDALKGGQRRNDPPCDPPADAPTEPPAKGEDGS